MIKENVELLYKSFFKTEIPTNIPKKISLFFALRRISHKSHLPQKFEVITEKIFGYQISCYSYSSLKFLINEIFIAGEYSFQSTMKNPVIIDCGANIGISVLYFKRTLPNCRIIAFEPNPYSYKLLNQNIKENNITGVETHELALYDKESTIPFFIRKDVGTPSASIRSDRGGERMLPVNTKKLSFYLNDLESVDLVKMDVEGAEIHIIKDLVITSTIGKVKNYYIEYHHNLNTDKSNLSSFLKNFEDNGYSYKVRGNFRNQKGKRFQNLFLHFFKEK